MDPMERNRRIAFLWLFLPFLGWYIAVRRTETLTDPKIKALFHIVGQTFDKPPLMLGLAAGFGLAAFTTWLIIWGMQTPFTGERFKRFLRGTRIVTADKLRSETREKKKKQILIGDIPMPTGVETTHLLIGGATGTGKSVLIRGLAYSGLLRGDRFLFCDPNGDLLSKFYRKGDRILNPYDTRTEGWSFYNEIRTDYDYKRYAMSLVPRGKSPEEEEWNSFGRLLLSECARKLAMNGNPSVRDLFHWCTIEEPAKVKEFLAGTAAESLFVGAEQALASARFVLADKLPEHLEMPAGDFSIRRFLEDDQAGNLFLPWREDMAVALRPLISAWADVVCTSVLSLPESKTRRIWLCLDELASLEKLSSLVDALTKGRKHGLRVVAGLQSVSQLDDLYGQKEAQTLRSCFRSMVVLGGSKSDSQTAEEFSKALGEHEVIREDKSTSGRGSNLRDRKDRERVVLPAEIMSMPDLTAIVSFAGDLPIARTKLEYQQFKVQAPAFAERSVGFGG